MKNTNLKSFVQIAMIAAIYTVVSLFLAPFTYGAIQVRIAEALTLLPLLNKNGIWGVTLGCFLTNIIGAAMGVNILGYVDAIIGTLATFVAALGTYYLREKTFHGIPIASLAMPILVNGIVIGLELGFVLFPGPYFWQGTFLSMLEVAVGELVSILIGWILIRYMKKMNFFQ